MIPPQTYTATDLVDEAERAGYSDLTVGALRVMVHRGQFPNAPHGNGTKSDPKRWSEEDKQRLLDWCFLTQHGSRGDSTSLGLWLHGHHVTGAAELLGKQIEAVQIALGGQAISDGDDIDDDTFTLMNDHMTHVLTESHVLGDLVRGEYPSFHGLDWEEYEEMTDIDIPAAVLRSFPYAVSDPSTPGRVMYPSESIPRDVVRMLQKDEALSRLGYALGLQRHGEDGMYWSLPALVTIVRQASDEELESARWDAWFEVGMLVQDSDSRRRDVPSSFSLNLQEIFGEYKDMRHLLGAPALQSLLTLMVATSLHDRLSQTRSTRNVYLLVLAIRRLLKKPEHLPRKRDALLTAVFAFHPRYTQDPKIVDEFRKNMKRLRQGPHTNVRIRSRMNESVQEGRAGIDY